MLKFHKFSTSFDGHDMGEIVEHLLFQNSSMINNLQKYQNELEYIGMVIKQSKLSSLDEM